MHGAVRLLALALVLLLAGPAWAQDNKGYLGADLQDITKEEADKLGWEGPRGVRVTKPREGGPASGILAGDVIVTLDGVEIENKDRFTASIGDKGAGAQVRLRLLRDGKERTVNVTLSRRPAEQTTQVVADTDIPILQLDSGAHMALIKGIAFTPDGRQLVSASDDKIIRVWDWQSGKTLRIIRGHVGLSHEGKYFSMALSPDGRWIAAGGWLHKECAGRCGEIPPVRFLHRPARSAAQGPRRRGQRPGLLARRQAADVGQRPAGPHRDHLGRRQPQAAAPAARPHRSDLCARLLAGQRARLLGQLRQDGEDLVGARRQGDRHADRPQGQGAGAGRVPDRRRLARAAGTARRACGRAAPVATSAASRTRVRWSARSASRPTASCWCRAPAAPRSPTSGT